MLTISVENITCTSQVHVYYDGIVHNKIYCPSVNGPISAHIAAVWEQHADPIIYYIISPAPIIGCQHCAYCMIGGVYAQSTNPLYKVLYTPQSITLSLHVLSS